MSDFILGVVEFFYLDLRGFLILLAALGVVIGSVVFGAGKRGKREEMIGWGLVFIILGIIGGVVGYELYVENWSVLMDIALWEIVIAGRDEYERMMGAHTWAVFMSAASMAMAVVAGGNGIFLLVRGLKGIREIKFEEDFEKEIKEKEIKEIE
jgi:hypothetical protein